MLFSTLDPMISEGVQAVGTAAALMLVVSMIAFTTWSVVTRIFAD
jgi:hypothetical protein